MKESRLSYLLINNCNVITMINYSKSRKQSVTSYHSCFLAFVHCISGNISSGYSIASPYEAHWHQSTEGLPHFIGIACGNTKIDEERTLPFLCPYSEDSFWIWKPNTW